MNIGDIKYIAYLDDIKELEGELDGELKDVIEDLNKLNEELAKLNNNIGDIDNLNTENKENLVLAINEIKDTGGIEIGPYQPLDSSNKIWIQTIGDDIDG